MDKKVKKKCAKKKVRETSGFRKQTRKKKRGREKGSGKKGATTFSITVNGKMTLSIMAKSQYTYIWVVLNAIFLLLY
jgi:hypothetical protein